jgi:hypothetical protein
MLESNRKANIMQGHLLSDHADSTNTGALDELRRAGNESLLESILANSFKGAEISKDRKKFRLDGTKFKIAVDGRTMFLCVSLSYLTDQREHRIRADFEKFRLGRAMPESPEAYFFLSNTGLQLLPASVAASYSMD